MWSHRSTGPPEVMDAFEQSVASNRDLLERLAK